MKTNNTSSQVFDLSTLMANADIIPIFHIDVPESYIKDLPQKRSALNYLNRYQFAFYFCKSFNTFYILYNCAKGVNKHDNTYATKQQWINRSIPVKSGKDIKRLINDHLISFLREHLIAMHILVGNGNIHYRFRQIAKDIKRMSVGNISQHSNAFNSYNNYSVVVPSVVWRRDDTEYTATRPQQILIDTLYKIPNFENINFVFRISEYYRNLSFISKCRYHICDFAITASDIIAAFNIFRHPAPL